MCICPFSELKNKIEIDLIKQSKNGEQPVHNASFQILPTIIRLFLNKVK